MKRLYSYLKRVVRLSVRQEKCAACEGTGRNLQISAQLMPNSVCTRCEGDGWVMTRRPLPERGVAEDRSHPELTPTQLRP